MLYEVITVPHVPHEGIAGTIEGAMECNGQLHDPKVAGKVAAIGTDDFDYGSPDFFRKEPSYNFV